YVNRHVRSPGDRVFAEGQDVGVDFVELFELDRAHAEPLRGSGLTTPEVERVLDCGIRGVDVAVAIKVVVCREIMKLQPGWLIGVELETRRLEPHQEAAWIDDGKGDQNRITGLERGTIRLAEQAVAGHLEAEKVFRSVGRRLVPDAH